MSDDPKTATHLEPNDLLTLVRCGKWRAELGALEALAKSLDAQAQGLIKKLNPALKGINDKYGIDPTRGEGADDETGEVKRIPVPPIPGEVAK